MSADGFSLGLGIDRDLVCDFFLYFSRYEYALKRSGFAEGNEDRVDPNWKQYAETLRDKFLTVTDSEFIQAVEFLESEPPRKQVLNGNELGWADYTRRPAETQEAWLLGLVRTVRNNLFHGGKFSDGQVSDPARNHNLLKACLVVLERALELAPKTKEWFVRDLKT